MSRTPHGVRELKHWFWVLLIVYLSRTPHGVRELKRSPVATEPRTRRRTPHGVRELKHNLDDLGIPPHIRRTPHGVRELKRLTPCGNNGKIESHPARGT